MTGIQGLSPRFQCSRTSVRFGNESTDKTLKAETKTDTPQKEGIRSAMGGAIKKYPGWSIFLSFLLGSQAISGCSQIMDNITRKSPPAQAERATQKSAGSIIIETLNPNGDSAKPKADPE